MTQYSANSPKMYAQVTFVGILIIIHFILTNTTQ